MKLFDTHCVALYQELSIKSDQNLGIVSKGHLLSVMLFIASLSSNTNSTSGFHHSSCYWLSPLQLLYVLNECICSKDPLLRSLTNKTNHEQLVQCYVIPLLPTSKTTPCQYRGQTC